MFEDVGAKKEGISRGFSDGLAFYPTGLGRLHSSSLT